MLQSDVLRNAGLKRLCQWMRVSRPLPSVRGSHTRRLTSLILFFPPLRVAVGFTGLFSC